MTGMQMGLSQKVSSKLTRNPYFSPNKGNLKRRLFQRRLFHIMLFLILTTFRYIYLGDALMHPTLQHRFKHKYNCG